MAYSNDFQRKMYSGNWKCSKCDANINELPFEPDESRIDQLLCGNCHKEKRNSFGGGRDGGGRERRPFGGEQRQMHQGNWQCSQCNSSITELPFEPDPSRINQLLCKNCHRERKQSFGGGEGRFRR